MKVKCKVSSSGWIALVLPASGNKKVPPDTAEGEQCRAVPTGDGGSQVPRGYIVSLLLAQLSILAVSVSCRYYKEGTRDLGWHVPSAEKSQNRWEVQMRGDDY